MLKAIKSEDAIKSIVEGNKNFYSVFYDQYGIEEKIETKEILDIIKFKEEKGSSFPIIFVDNSSNESSVVVDTNYKPI